MSADADAPQLTHKPDVVPRQCRDFPHPGRECKLTWERGRGMGRRREREDTSESLKKGAGGDPPAVKMDPQEVWPRNDKQGRKSRLRTGARAISRMSRVTGSQQGRELNWC